LDETGFNQKLLPIHGWGTKGKSLKMNYLPTYGNLSCLAAISNSKLLGCQIFKGGVTAQDFACFLINIFNEYPYILENLSEWVFFCDNAKIHKAIVQKFFSCFHMVYNAPYSPQLNSIEEYFSLLKYYFRKENFLKNANELSQLIYLSAKKIKKREIAGFVYHSVQVLETC
jgi:hypothetical protein